MFSQPRKTAIYRIRDFGSGQLPSQVFDYKMIVTVLFTIDQNWSPAQITIGRQDVFRFFEKPACRPQPANFHPWILAYKVMKM